jgi:hypothetical protein
VRSYLIDVAIERVLEYRYNWWFMVPWVGAGDGRETADVPSDYTTTNTQEEGVDEIDIVKTNGTHLYAVEGESLHIMRSWPAEATSELATVKSGDHASARIGSWSHRKPGARNRSFRSGSREPVSSCWMWRIRHRQR